MTNIRTTGFFDRITSTDHTTRERPTRVGPSGGINVLLWVLQVFAAAGFIFSAFGKFTANPAAVEVFETMGTAAWLPYPLATLEVLGAIALVVPQLRLYGLAALAFVALTLGAVLTHLIWGASPVPATVFLVVSAVIAWGRRSNTADLIAGLLRAVTPSPDRRLS